jgi:hypothetical protein
MQTDKVARKETSSSTSYSYGTSLISCVHIHIFVLSVRRAARRQIVASGLFNVWASTAAMLSCHNTPQPCWLTLLQNAGKNDDKRNKERMPSMWEHLDDAIKHPSNGGLMRRKTHFRRIQITNWTKHAVQISPLGLLNANQENRGWSGTVRGLMQGVSNRRVKTWKVYTDDARTSRPLFVCPHTFNIHSYTTPGSDRPLDWMTNEPYRTRLTQQTLLTGQWCDGVRAGHIVGQLKHTSVSSSAFNFLAKYRWSIYQKCEE